jgi:hypothetical protein
MGRTNRQALSRDCRAWRKVVMAAKVNNGVWCLRIIEQEQEEGEEEEKSRRRRKSRKSRRRRRKK